MLIIDKKKCNTLIINFQFYILLFIFEQFLIKRIVNILINIISLFLFHDNINASCNNE